MVHFTGLLENARHPCGWTPGAGPLVGDPCKNRVRAGIGGWPGTATGGQIHVVHISHTHPPKEIIQALRKYLLGKKTFEVMKTIHESAGAGCCWEMWLPPTPLKGALISRTFGYRLTRPLGHSGCGQIDPDTCTKSCQRGTADLLNH